LNTATEISESLAALRGAASELRGESQRLADALAGRERILAEGFQEGNGQPRRRVGERRSSSAAQLLVPQLVAACVPLAAFALVEVNVGVAAAVAVIGAVFLPVRWWMLATATLGMVALLAFDPGIREGGSVDRVSALIALFALMAVALLLQESWERLRARRGEHP
jgi:hypothetical protein